jgi:diguanylate cyclase (GGDEF)-like protein
MKNIFFLRVSIVLSTIFIYSIVLIYTTSDKNVRIDTIKTQQIDTLNTHYKLALKSFKLTSDTIVEAIHNDNITLDLLTKYIDASNDERISIRKRLHKRLENHYKRIQKRGVLQFHFVMPNNVTSLRMHKPSKFDDDLTDFKFSYRYVNQTKKEVSGLEQGKTAPSFRNVSPLINNGKHIGIVDIAFAPEVLQENIYDIDGIYSHFIIQKEVFDKRGWQRNDNKNDYKASIENDNYFEYLHQHLVDSIYSDNSLYELLKPLKKDIFSKMSNYETFSLYRHFRNEDMIIAFLPIKNMQEKVIAYLISYSTSSTVSLVIKDFYKLNFIILLGIILISYFLYRSILHNQELKKEKKKFQKLSEYDVLTTLPNRSLFQDRLERSIVKGLRHNNKFALLFIDIDNFKDINDTYGHANGDKLLYSVGDRINKLLRDEDTLARLGGDEYVVILEDIKNPIHASITANKIIELFKEPLKINDKEHLMSVSIGVSIFPDDSKDLTELLKYSDIAMYKAKKDGKNNVQFYSSSMSKEIVERVTIEKELRDAIDNEEFLVYYQHQVDGTTDKLIGMEALVRWEHPTMGLVSPAKFIPLAESTGLIVELDRLVMKTAMAQIVQWYKDGLNPGILSMNLAVKQLKQKDFIQILINLMEETSCKAEWIELEVTESQIMANPNEAIKLLTQISDLGIELAVDDFGTGYSSLAYLKRLPIDKLKIDQEFVRGLPDDEEDAAIANAIIALAQSLNLKVIAEGVETKGQRDFIVENGCENIQGYYYSKPVPANEFELILRDGFKG